MIECIGNCPHIPVLSDTFSARIEGSEPSVSTGAVLFDTFSVESVGPARHALLVNSQTMQKVARRAVPVTHNVDNL